MSKTIKNSKSKDMEIPKKEGLLKIELTEEEGTWYGTVYKSVTGPEENEEAAYIWASIEQLSADSVDTLKEKIEAQYPGAYSGS